MKPNSGIWKSKDFQETRLDLSSSVICRRKHEKSSRVWHSTGKSCCQEFKERNHERERLQYELHNAFRL